MQNKYRLPWRWVPEYLDTQYYLPIYEPASTAEPGLYIWCWKFNIFEIRCFIYKYGFRTIILPSMLRSTRDVVPGSVRYREGTDVLGRAFKSKSSVQSTRNRVTSLPQHSIGTPPSMPPSQALATRVEVYSVLNEMLGSVPMVRWFESRATIQSCSQSSKSTTSPPSRGLS